MPICGTVGTSKRRLSAIVFEPLFLPLDPAWLVRRGSFFVRHVKCGYGFVKPLDIAGWVCGGLCVFRRPDDHPHGYQLGKSTTRAGAGAGDYSGLPCVRGVWVRVRGADVSAR